MTSWPLRPQRKIFRFYRLSAVSQNSVSLSFLHPKRNVKFLKPKHFSQRFRSVCGKCGVFIKRLMLSRVRSIFPSDESWEFQWKKILLELMGNRCENISSSVSGEAPQRFMAKDSNRLAGNGIERQVKAFQMCWLSEARRRIVIAAS